MSRRPVHLEVFDPVDRWIHWAALMGGLGSLATGPLVETPGLARAVGLGTSAGTLHGALGAVAALAWGLHLVRVCLEWLEGGNPWGLVPRPADVVRLVSTLVQGTATGPPRDRFSYRERLPYGVFLIALPVLVLSGWMVGHPGQGLALAGPEGVLAAARIHTVVGSLIVPFLMWHVYFAVLAPEKLWWNPGWITGKVSWARAARAWPGWTNRIEAEFGTDEAPVDEAPSVQSLLETGNRAARQGDLEAAETTFREALRLYPGYSQALFNLGITQFRAGARADAAETLRRFLEQDPFSPVANRARELLDRAARGTDDDE